MIFMAEKLHKTSAIYGMALALKTYITLMENHDKILSEAIQV